MNQHEWIHIAEPPEGIFQNPYVFWYERYGQHFDNGYPGDRAELTPRWIVDLQTDRLRGQKWTSAMAETGLAALRIVSERPATSTAARAAASGPPGTHIQHSAWHRAPLRDESIPNDFAGLAPAPSAPPRRRGQGKPKVIVAVIDDAINFAHHRFQGPDKTSRVDYAWVMDGTPEDPDAPTVPFGREWSNAQIEDILKSAKDEEEVLERLELSDFAQNETIGLTRRTTHGTHILDLASGFEPEDKEGRDHRIISVQLPRRVILEASGATLHLFLKAAIRFIEARARQIAIAAEEEHIPLVVNFSYGLGAGSRMGTHPIEKALGVVTDQRDPNDPVNPVHIVLPAGNRFRAEGHASTVADSDGEHELHLNWLIPAQDSSPNFLEVWLPDDVDNPHVVLTPPNEQFGGAAPVIEDGGVLALRAFPLPWHSDVTNHEVAWVGADTEEKAAGVKLNRTRVLVAIAPTHVPRIDLPFAPSGEWRVTVKAKLKAGQELTGWIQRDERPYGYRRLGQPSRLLDHNETPAQRKNRELTEYREVPTYPGSVSGYGTLNGIASVKGATVVAGYRWRDLSMASYSSAGSNYVPSPDVAAISDRSRILGGVLASGSRSGSKVALNGTSVAVPQVARRLAQKLVAPTGRALRLEPGDAVLALTEDIALDPNDRRIDDFRGRKKRLNDHEGGIQDQLDRAFAPSRLVRK